METFRFSLITPRSFDPTPTSQINQSKKRTRDQFEAPQTKPLPVFNDPIAPLSFQKTTTFRPTAVQPPQELHKYKHEKLTESQATALMAGLRSKSEYNLKYTSVSQVVEQYMELDQKFADLKYIQDFSASTDEYGLLSNQFLCARQLSYPRRVFEYYNTVSTKDSVIRGIFFEASICYVAINNRIFLWRYSDRNTDEKFDPAAELEQRMFFDEDDRNFFEKELRTEVTAIAVGKPKPYVFVSYRVDYIMIVATYESIEIFSIEDDNGMLVLKPTDFILATDGVIVRSLHCTKTGRVFAGQDNGKVVELAYEESKKLLGIVKHTNLRRVSGSKKKLQDYLPSFQQIFFSYHYSVIQLTYDETRHILYALVHENNPRRFKILVYDLGVTGQEFEYAFEITDSSFKNKLVDVCMKIERSEIMDLVITSISAIDRTQSDTLNLLAVTNLGIRVYLTIPTEPLTDKAAARYQTVENISYLFDLWRPTTHYELRLIKLPIVQSVGQIFSGQNPSLTGNRVKIISGLISSKYQINQAEMSKECGVVIANRSDPSIEPDGLYSFVLNSSFHNLNSKKLNNVHLKALTPESISVINLSHHYETIECFHANESDLLVSQSLRNLLGHNLPKYFVSSRLMGHDAQFLALESLGEVARQTYYNPSMLTVFTNQAIDFVIKIRPIDLLFQVLDLQIKQENDAEFRSFVENYGAADTCAMLLQIYCNRESYYYVNAAEYEHFDRLGIRAKRYDSEHMMGRMSQKSSKQRLSTHVDHVVNQMKRVQAYPELIEQAAFNFFQIGDLILKYETGYQTQNQFYERLGRAIEPEKRKYTSKLEGIVLYFGRLVRPIWNCYIFNKWAYSAMDVNASVEVFKKNELKILRGRLNELKSFLVFHNEMLLSAREEFQEFNARNSEKIRIYERGTDPALYTDYIDLQYLSRGRKDIFFSGIASQKIGIIDDSVVLEDQRTLDNLYLFLDKVIQTLDVIMLLTAERNKMIDALFQIEESERETIFNTQFSHLFHEVKSQQVLKAMLFVHLKITHSSHFSELGRFFITNFNQYFTEMDLTICEAEKNLEQATHPSSDRQPLITDALNKLHRNLGYVTNNKIVQLFNQFAALGLYTEYVRLLITRAQVLKNLTEAINKQKMAFSENPNVPVLSRESISSVELDNNHDLNFTREYIMELLESLQSSILGKISTSKSQGAFDKIKPEEKYQLRNKFIIEMLAFEDKFMHICLVKWFLKHRLFAELVEEVKSDYFEEVVLNESLPEIQKYKILHKYYVKNKIFEKVYEVALKLATTAEFGVAGLSNGNMMMTPEMPLNERIDYLRDAKMCLDTLELQHRADPQKRERLLKLLKELHQILNFADLQQKIDRKYGELMKSHSWANVTEYQDICNKRAELNRTLLPHEILYQNFIVPDRLYEYQVYYLIASDKIDRDTLLEAYSNFIWSEYDERPNEWPNPIKEKLVSLYVKIKEKNNASYDTYFVFPLQHILATLEEVNRNCVRFQVEIENIVNRFMNRNAQVPVSNISVPFWTAYFFADDLEIPFDELFDAYKAIYHYPTDKITQQNHTDKYLLANSMLTLIDCWLEAAYKQLRNVMITDMKAQFGYMVTQSLYAKKFEVRNLIVALKDDLEQIRELKLMKDEFISMTLEFIERVSVSLDTIIKEIGESTKMKDVPYTTPLFTSKAESFNDSISSRSYRSFR